MDLTLFGLGSTETINPQQYGEFKPRMSKPTAPICRTNKWERSFQHWELANPEQTSRFGEPRVTQGNRGCCCLPSGPLGHGHLQPAGTGPSSHTAQPGSLPSEWDHSHRSGLAVRQTRRVPTHRCAHTSSHRHSNHIATLRGGTGAYYDRSSDCLERFSDLEGKRQHHPSADRKSVV